MVNQNETRRWSSSLLSIFRREADFAGKLFRNLSGQRMCFYVEIERKKGSLHN